MALGRELVFELRPEHLALLAASRVRWDDSEFGAAAIDSKRPYGNSAVLADIDDILVREFGREPGETPTEELYRLHHDTEVALQIVLARRAFEPGVYVSRDYGWSWERRTP